MKLEDIAGLLYKFYFSLHEYESNPYNSGVSDGIRFTLETFKRELKLE